MQLRVHFVAASYTFHAVHPSVSLSTLKSHEALKMQTSWMNDDHRHKIHKYKVTTVCFHLNWNWSPAPQLQLQSPYTDPWGYMLSDLVGPRL